MNKPSLIPKTKAIIISDTHGNISSLPIILKKHKDADYLIHLGDGIADIHRYPSLYTTLTIVTVPGNCDPSDTNPSPHRLLKISEHRILLMHGHTLGVKGGLTRATTYSRAKSADLLLFGHTHLPLCQYLPSSNGEKPLYLFNPGSLGRPVTARPTYGILEFRGNQLLLSHGRL
ncbi:MAG: YfcE family phosphodiesterase [Clostridiales bacterium]|nr:YfcE family phosphodiesterase [Clostridiales bacterium]